MDETPPQSKPPPMPGWVKAFVVVGVLLAIAFIGLHLAGRGFGHGP
jgi:hypothetical protein